MRPNDAEERVSRRFAKPDNRTINVVSRPNWRRKVESLRAAGDGECEHRLRSDGGRRSRPATCSGSTVGWRRKVGNTFGHDFRRRHRRVRRDTIIRVTEIVWDVEYKLREACGAEDVFDRRVRGKRHGVFACPQVDASWIVLARHMRCPAMQHRAVGVIQIRAGYFDRYSSVVPVPVLPET